ncbi:MAG: citrate lyase acyl carrier protein [Prevotella sp.]|nr:citrate lyase acyl carrier protein [Prevotella sp.]MCM1075077.1 citrate lyase acyl carrier protein [Ruminococcus sp.]
MDIKRAQAGTLESGDIMIEILPGTPGSGLTVNLDSTVGSRFGKRIKEVICETLQGLNLTDVEVDAHDKGALDCTIRARATAAAVRATGNDVWKD